MLPLASPLASWQHANLCERLGIGLELQRRKQKRESTTANAEEQKSSEQVEKPISPRGFIRWWLSPALYPSGELAVASLIAQCLWWKKSAALRRRQCCT